MNCLRCNAKIDFPIGKYYMYEWCKGCVEEWYEINAWLIREFMDVETWNKRKNEQKHTSEENNP
jgi:hypothetical protein